MPEHVKTQWSHSPTVSRIEEADIVDRLRDYLATLYVCIHIEPVERHSISAGVTAREVGIRSRNRIQSAASRPPLHSPVVRPVERHSCYFPTDQQFAQPYRH